MKLVEQSLSEICYSAKESRKKMFFQVNQASKLPHALAYQGQARVYSRCRLDAIERLSVSSQHITLFQAALLARRTRSYIGAWICLQFVQLLG